MGLVQVQCGITKYCTSEIPMGMARDALSPPTIALACAADLNCLYLRMKYIAPGRVPSQGDAFPTLIGSLFPTSHNLQVREKK